MAIVVVLCGRAKAAHIQTDGEIGADCCSRKIRNLSHPLCDNRISFLFLKFVFIHFWSAQGFRLGLRNHDLCSFVSDHLVLLETSAIVSIAL